MAVKEGGPLTPPRVATFTPDTKRMKTCAVVLCMDGGERIKGNEINEENLE